MTQAISLTEQSGRGVQWLVFDNQPRRNAMTLAMWQQAEQEIQQYQQDPLVKAVIMRGAGDQAFVSGADISQFESQRNNADAAKHYAKTSDRARAALSSFEKPLIAMVRGYCFGAGVDIALRADIRIAGDDAVFCIPAARLGLAYGFDSVKLLAQLVGPSVAKDLLLSGCRLNAQEALRVGLVNRVYPAAQLEAEVAAYGATIAANAPLTMRSAKFSIDQVFTDAGQRDMPRVEQLIWDCFDSEDYKEGRLAFKEKRSPVFQGR
ncbi:MAG TPA: enoyl-CoA hydratase [Eoetvoesiella sp.]